MDSPRNPQDKLDWLAFRYVANELSGLERVSFEGQLASDQSAREAVARMVQRTTELSQALSAGTDRPTIAASQSAWKGRATRWLTVGIASSLALFAAVLASRHFTIPALDEPIAQYRSQPSVEPADLAFAWAEVRAPQDDFADLLSELPVFNDLLLADVDQTDEADQSLGPPSWMIAAVARMDQNLSDEMGLQE